MRAVTAAPKDRASTWPAQQPEHTQARLGDVERLVLDVHGLRSERALRIVAALVSFGSSAWLFAVGRSLVQHAFAAAALFFGVVFLVRARKQKNLTRDASQHYLDIGEPDLALTEGEHARREAWSEVEAVEVDEDRLVVVLRLRQRAPWILEPRYGGLPPQQLAERLHASLTRARARGQNPSA